MGGILDGGLVMKVSFCVRQLDEDCLVLYRVRVFNNNVKNC